MIGLPYIASLVAALALFGGVQTWRLGNAKDALKLQQTQCDLNVARAEAEALGRWGATVSFLDLSAREDDEKLAADIAEIKRRLAGIRTRYTDHAAANPLPAGCVPDDQRVRDINASRGHNE